MTATLVIKDMDDSVGERLRVLATAKNRTVEQQARVMLKLDLPIYECAYPACALQQSGPLVTADDAFFRKAVANGFQSHVTLLR